MHIIGNQSVAALPRAAPRGPVANRGGTRRESILTLHNLCDIILNDMGVSPLHVKDDLDRGGPPYIDMILT